MWRQRSINSITGEEHGLTAHRSKEKIHINVVVIGHVDSGKSTTTGRKRPPLCDGASTARSQLHRFDLQVRWYRQAYDREVREGTWQSHTISLSTSPKILLIAAHQRLAGHKFWRGLIERNLHWADSGFWAASLDQITREMRPLSDSDVEIYFEGQHTLTTCLTGSRRVRQGLLQVRVGARQAQGRA
jgi:hypothetical protein